MIKEYTKEFIDTISAMSPHLSLSEKWENIIKIVAITIANANEFNKEIWQKREEEYIHAFKRLDNRENITKLFSIIVSACIENPCEDFLGDIYMRLNLGNANVGQFFTPQTVAEMMVKMSMKAELDDLEISIKNNKERIISICDPCVGAGINLLAGAKEMLRRGIDYKKYAYFEGQDINRTAAMMSYIQLSLNGCSGVIIVGDSLNNPVVSDENGNIIKQKGQEFWLTPEYTENLLSVKIAS